MTSAECAENIKHWVESFDSEKNLNEATTRLRYINTLFEECLNWDRRFIVAEERVADAIGYVDYVFTNPHRVLIVEAKREGIEFEIPPSSSGRRVLSLKHLLDMSPEIRKAVTQVFNYCVRKGTRIAAVTNGRQFIIFIASRTDGIEPLSGSALVFRSPEEMQDHFGELWDALSPDGIQVNGIAKLLTETPEELPVKLKEFLPEYPGISRKTPQQADLETTSELLFEEIMNEHEIEEQFLRACYCPSEHLSKYTLQSRQILESRYSRLAALGVNLRELSDLGSSLLDPKQIRQFTTSKPILIVGDVNVGKTSFIRNLMKVEAPDLLSKFINVYIDFQTQANLEDDLHLFVKTEITSQLLSLHGINIEERNFVRGVYREELKNLSKTIYADLKKINPALLIQKEIEFLERKTLNNVSHLKVALSHLISQGRKIVIFLDNADQRSEQDQEKTFLIGQELARDFGTVVFISLRPETFERLKKQRLLVGYYSRVFTIRPPALEDVIKRRLDFVKRLARGELPIKALTAGGINLNTIVRLVDAFLASFASNRQIPECITNLSSGNVTSALSIMRDFFHNAHVPHERILSNSENPNYRMPHHYLIDSVVYKKYKYFNPRDSYVLNMFDISTLDSKEHFCVPLLLSILKQSTAEDGFEKISVIYTKLQDMGFSPVHVEFSMTRLLLGGLIESTHFGQDTENQPRLRATERGLYHLTRLGSDISYVEAMLVDTAILDPIRRDAVGNEHATGDSINRAQEFCEYLDDVWKNSNLSTEVYNWPECSIQLKNTIQKIKNSASK